MTAQIQFNPSTFAVAFDPITKAVQMAETAPPGDDCSYCNSLASDVIQITFSGVELCTDCHVLSQWSAYRLVWHRDINAAWELSRWDSHVGGNACARALSVDVPCAFSKWYTPGVCDEANWMYDDHNLIWLHVQKMNAAEVRVLARVLGITPVFEATGIVESGCFEISGLANEITDCDPSIAKNGTVTIVEL